MMINLIKVVGLIIIERSSLGIGAPKPLLRAALV